MNMTDENHPNLYILRINYFSLSLNHQELIIDVAPYNKETGSILRAKARRIYANQEDIKNIEELSYALECMNESLLPTIEWRKNPSKKKIDDLEEGGEQVVEDSSEKEADQPSGVETDETDETEEESKIEPKSKKNIFGY